MPRLTHFRLCPFSRSVRALLAELSIGVELIEERPWEARPQLMALNPAGELPILEFDGGIVLCGAYAISEYLGEELVRPEDGLIIPAFPGNRDQRAEIRRLVDWFHGKLNRDVSRWLLEEKVYRQVRGGGTTPDTEVMRAVRTNMRYHLGYIGHLVDQRSWLAGDDLSFADLAAASHISIADYLGEVPWDEHPSAKLWYARLKSRKAFRTLLADRLPGMPPPMHYTDPDF